MVVYGRENNLIGEADSAAVGEVGAAELAARPFLRRGELLETVPGLIITQHSGDGKANQYFLRGFNLDHGTDFATTVDGMPVNLPSNAHGQGYSDLNFIIPETVSSIAYEKGTYYAANGDFSAAGAAQFHLLDSLPAGFVKTEVGENDYYRLVAADSARTGVSGALVGAVEYGYYNGPWTKPEDANHVNFYGRESWNSGDSQFALTAMAYHAAWNSTDQVPQRAIDAGQIDRFGAIDPSDGGTSSRANLDFDWRRQDSGGGEQHVNLYAMYYRLSLYSDFTYFLDDPVNGDQFGQRDRRGIFGGTATDTWLRQLAGRPLTLTAGFQGRSDVIDLGLVHSRSRGYLDAIDLSSVHEDAGGIYAEAKYSATPWLRAQVGWRADGAFFGVDDSIPGNSGRRTAGILSPKLNLVFGPWDKTEFYLDAGDGFHSNDARGTVEHVDHDGDAVEPVTPLVRAEGAEAGVRTSVVPGLVSTLSVWALDLASELTFDGDEGGTDPSGRTRRYGVEFANFYHATSWLALDGDAAFTRARYRDETNGGYDIANSIGTVVSGGVTAGTRKGWFGSLRARYFGPQPIVETGEVYEPSSLTCNGRIGWRSAEWEVALDVLNVFNRSNDDIAYYYASRLPGEPADGVNDIHLHPGEPREVRCEFRRNF